MFKKQINLLKINFDKEYKDCFIKVDPNVYAKLTDTEKRVLNCHVAQAVDILKNKISNKGDNEWRR